MERFAKQCARLAALVCIAYRGAAMGPIRASMLFGISEISGLSGRASSKGLTSDRSLPGS